MTSLNLYRHIRDRESLEREYSPSSCVADLRVLVDAYAARSAAARAQLRNRVVFTYGAARAECLDFFPAPSLQSCGTPRPVIVYIHGGYWQELGKDEHSFPAPACHRHDLSYIAIGYGLAPESTLDQMIERCRRALAWIVGQCGSLGIDPAAIHVAGCSAGAQLAAMTALSAWSRLGLCANPIRSLTLLSGIFDLRPLPLTYINIPLRLGAEAALRHSPLLLIEAARGEFPPTLVVHGDNETSEFKRQSVEFAAAIARKGGAVELQEIPGRNHFDLIFDLLEEDTHFGALSLRHIRGAGRDEDMGA